MKSCFHAGIALFGTALLGAALLPACGAECAAACYSSLTLTVTNADATTHSYTITVQGSGLATATETCALAAGSTAPSCKGDVLQTFAANGQIQLELAVTPVPVDVTVTRDGTQVATAHLVPTMGTDKVCGTECATGTATLALP